MDREPPDFRATVLRDGAVRLVDWGPWLATGGPLYTLLDARGRAGIGIADLTVIRDDENIALEVIFDFCCGDTPGHRATLRDWAARVGYRRAWFGGEIIDLECSPGGSAQTRCTGCRARLVEGGTSFWDFVRLRGAFPTACVLCGSDLPQWTPPRQTRRAASDPDATEILRRPACK
jgi:hypothetical protein